MLLRSSGNRQVARSFLTAAFFNFVTDWFMGVEANNSLVFALAPKGLLHCIPNLALYILRSRDDGGETLQLSYVKCDVFVFRTASPSASVV